uniref:Uncharacterized protein LOC111131672 n=1 Tax=Crassostrea virginica TaxID=6565 RepID=A0A8B8E6H1_CRAVI|nr:uncharacterized protein LOC111131672 [Crassostrea virginica]
MEEGSNKIFHPYNGGQPTQRRGQGPCILFMLDTSSSMKGEGFVQMKEAFVAMIQGYANHPLQDHDVGVICFGRETEKIHYFSNDYDKILHLLDETVCAGPSPLMRALEFSIHILGCEAHDADIGPFHVRPKIVIISDGRVTTNGDLDDACDENNTHEKIKIANIAGKIGYQNSLVCIAVGRNPDICFLASVAYSSRDGKLLMGKEEAAQYSRYSKNMGVAAEIIGILPTTDYLVEDVRTAVRASDVFETTTEKDIIDIYGILTNRQTYEMNIYFNEQSLERSLYVERDPELPPIGTRVRRGPSWPYTNQDSHVAGTIIGHWDQRPNFVYVEWDTCMRFPYHFETSANSKVVVCNEPRILLREKIAVGCLVERGQDWKWSDQDGGEGSVGFVYRVKEDQTIYVRWSNGVKSNYRFGYDGKYDVSLCDPFDKELMRRLREQPIKWKISAADKITDNDGCETDETDGNEEYEESVEEYNTKGRNAKDMDTNCARSEKDICICNRCGGLASESKLTKEKTKKTSSLKHKVDELERKEGASLNSENNRCSWEWKSHTGEWVPFPKSENDKIQKAYDKNIKGTVLVAIDEDLFRVVMSRMIQINIRNRETHEIRHVG